MFYMQWNRWRRELIRGRRERSIINLMHWCELLLLQKCNFKLHCNYNSLKTTRMCCQLVMGKQVSISNRKKVQCGVFKKVVCLSEHCMSSKCIWAKCDVKTIFTFKTHFYCSFPRQTILRVPQKQNRSNVKTVKFDGPMSSQACRTRGHLAHTAERCSAERARRVLWWSGTCQSCSEQWNFLRYGRTCSHSR